MSTKQPYVGRFAPSPTGPLHFGSLVAALASYLDTHANSGRWLLRIEDLDPQRESPTAPALILKQLESFRLKHDGVPLYQSSRIDAYLAALNQLERQNDVFACTCSRKSIPGVYAGKCRGTPVPTLQDQSFSIRVNTHTARLDFDDLILGAQHSDLEHEIGDFIIKRKDGLFAYQLAVVVDDDYQNISHIIRGNDLLDSTPRQIYLSQKLSHQKIRYGHIPVILGDDDKKLSKQAHAQTVDSGDPITTLNLALKALGQKKQTRDSVDGLLSRAIQDWEIAKVPNTKGVHFHDLGLD